MTTLYKPMTAERTNTRIGTISISLAVIPWLALVVYAVLNPPCSSPLSQIKDVIIAGPVISFFVSLLGVIRDRPRKRAFIGLSISSAALLSLIALFVLILNSVATGGSSLIEVSTNPAPQNFEPGVYVRTETSYYDIEGRTEEELRDQTLKSGPLGHAAITEPSYRWQYTYRRVSNLCMIDRVRVDTRISFTYPKVKDAGLDPRLTEAWQKSIALLESHEKGHEEIDRNASQQIYDTLYAYLPAYESCDELGQKANALAQAVLDLAKEKNDEYDARTDHGLRTVRNDQEIKTQ